MQINSIIIVGGGSSGWFTGSALNKHVPEIDVTLIESPDVPTIGVGESTNLNINWFLQSLDITGVGKLVSMAVQSGRGVNSSLKIGICGEHGGDPSSIRFCKENGLDYVSCSPFRVPIARLAAAQAEL